MPRPRSAAGQSPRPELDKDCLSPYVPFCQWLSQCFAVTVTVPERFVIFLKVQGDKLPSLYHIPPIVGMLKLLKLKIRTRSARTSPQYRAVARSSPVMPTQPEYLLDAEQGTSQA